MCLPDGVVEEEESDGELDDAEKERWRREGSLNSEMVSALSMSWLRCR